MNKLLILLVPLIAMTCMANEAEPIASTDIPHGIGTLSPDSGFPIWLTENPDDFLPLITNQTSGLDWVNSSFEKFDSGSDEPVSVDILLIADDADNGGIHQIAVPVDGNPSIKFLSPDLTLPPPSVTGFKILPGNGYDFEAISIHHVSDSVLICQEGDISEIGVYFGKLDRSGGYKLSDGSRLAGHISGLRKIELPEWNSKISSLFRNNLGIEGITCTDDRLFIGIESPYEFTDRLKDRKSTYLAIYSINTESPADMETAELLSIHDTSEWENIMGVRVETICGLSAIDSNRIIGIDRDNMILFAVKFSDKGEFIDGRAFYLYAPGPALAGKDLECETEIMQPMLLRPSFESVTAVPAGFDEKTGEAKFRIYLAVDPWGPGWAVLDQTWYCESYMLKLKNLLPAIYRYSATEKLLFGE